MKKITLNDKPHWDKLMTHKLIKECGLSWEQARQVVGIIAEERQTADRDGYSRGYNNGYADSSFNNITVLN